MEKMVLDNDAYYKIWWSQVEKYDRHILTRLMPELPGIIAIFGLEDGEYFPVLFLASWRDGVRDGIKNFMDPFFSRYRALRESVEKKKYLTEAGVSHTLIESSPADLQDILYRLIQTYRPLNNSLSFPCSGRYKNIYVEELRDKKSDSIPITGNARRPLK
jgi:hypothetical protein